MINLNLINLNNVSKSRTLNTNKIQNANYRECSNNSHSNKIQIK